MGEMTPSRGILQYHSGFLQDSSKFTVEMTPTLRDSSVLFDTCEILSGFFEIDSDRGDISRDSSVLIEICEILSGFFQVSFEILAIFLINKRAGR